eukprot:PITA_11750
MVYVLQKYRHYLLDRHFKMYTDHSALKYLVNKLVLGGRICRLLLLFQEYDFEVVVKPRRLNAGPYHLSRIETSEEPTNLEEGLLDAHLYVKKELVIHAADFLVIVGHLYKMGNEEILRRYVPEIESGQILVEAHGGVARGHFAATNDVTTIQEVGNQLCRTYCVVREDGARYIITSIEYLTRWVEAQSVKDYMAAAVVKILFENVLTGFGCPKILMNDRGTHFLNETISALTEEFQIYHQQSTPYHPQANGIIEAFNKILETTLTKVCNAQRNDWDLRIPVVIWAYRTTCKKLTSQTPFRLVYGKEVIMPMEYIVPSLRVAAIIGMADRWALEEWLVQLEELEEEWFLAGFH